MTRPPTVAPPLDEFSLEEIEVIRLYRTMDDECREDAVGIMQNLARTFPRRHRPSLRLAAGSPPCGNGTSSEGRGHMGDFGAGRECPAERGGHLRLAPLAGLCRPAELPQK